MIKVQVRGNQLTEGTYPQIRVADTGMVVLFIGPKVGTVLDIGCAPEGLYNIGYYTETWDESSFSPWRGTVTLTQD